MVEGTKKWKLDKVMKGACALTHDHGETHKEDTRARTCTQYIYIIMFTQSVEKKVMFGKYYTNYIKILSVGGPSNSPMTGETGETQAAPLVADRHTDGSAATEVTQKQQMTSSPLNCELP